MWRDPTKQRRNFIEAVMHPEEYDTQLGPNPHVHPVETMWQTPAKQRQASIVKMQMEEVDEMSVLWEGVSNAVLGKTPVEDVIEYEGVAWTPLMIAAQWKNWNHQFQTSSFSADMVEALLLVGADPNAQCRSTGVTALFFAVKYADVHTVELLLDNKADLHHRDSVHGKTCLYNAAEHADARILRLLLSRGLSASDRLCVITRISAPTEKMAANAAECMLLADQRRYLSWHIFGAPSLDRWANAFVLLLSAGAPLGPPAMALVSAVAQSRHSPPSFPCTPHQEALALSALGCPFPGQHQLPTDRKSVV